jgi:murein DD-endopeptidase MepM/ murein hydrolase activator NlpD
MLNAVVALRFGVSSMRSRVSAVSGRRVLKVVAAGLLAGASAACSDSGRFAASPFTNPFASTAASKVDAVTTGSSGVKAAPLGSVTSQPLPSALPKAAATPAARVASTTLQNASPVGGTAAGWTAAGGTPVTVGPGETASTLSTRYGVPVAAINAANGGVIQPGGKAIIPVYAGAGQPKTGLMQPAAQAAAPAPKPTASASGDAGPVATETPAPASTRAAAVPLPPQRPAAPPPTLKQAAKPIVPAKPAKPNAADDDDDDDDAPKKIVAAAPKQPVVQQVPARTPQAAAPKPAQPAQPKPQQQQAQAQPKPQPRVIPMAPQEPPKQQVAEIPKSDPVTTQSIPQSPKVVEPDSDKPEFRWPARGRVISGFGAKGGNGDGIAIAVPEGTAVKAAETGVVAYAGEELKGYGKLVLVRHDNGFVSAYAHNGELNVKRGDKVSRGQTIAKSGATGNVTSPQLHFELRKGSTPVDPTKYLEN